MAETNDKNFRDFESVGIKLPENIGRSRFRMLCPFCSAGRKTINRTEKCLSVNLDNGLYHCYNCGVSGVVHSVQEMEDWKERHSRQQGQRIYQNKSTKQYVLPGQFPASFLIKNCTLDAGSQPLVDYLTQQRCLDLDLLQRYRITLPFAKFEKRTQGQSEKAEYESIQCIGFNYFDGTRYINTKFRTLDKRFSLVHGAELIPWNIDAIQGQPVCYITEGEFDALTLIQCGYPQTISVPNGAQKNLDFLDRFVESHLEDKVQLVLALDTDEAGIRLRDELVRRFGSERCPVVQWPQGCKDANDVLVRHGVQAVRDCIDNAQLLPITGVLTARDLEEEMRQLFENGMKHGEAIQLAGFDQLMTFEEGRYMVVSGRPGDGKSEFIDELCMRLCLLHGWKIAYFSPENNPVEIHLRKLCERLTRYPFKHEGHMTEQLLEGCLNWLAGNVCHIMPDTGRIQSGGIRLDDILDIARQTIARLGTRIVVIDPLNRIESDAQFASNELAWYAHVNNRLYWFAQQYRCLVILVAHPRKVNRANFDGKKRRVEMNDINGSADFGNKADYCVIVDRDDDRQVVTVYADKVKFKHLGSRGECTLHYEKNSGRYLPCSLRRLDSMAPDPKDPRSVVVETDQGVRYEKTIDWRNFHTCWIDQQGSPILARVLSRQAYADQHDGQLSLFTNL